MPQVYLLLGTNLGNKLLNLNNALALLLQKVGKLQKASAIYETMPWGVEQQPIFYNQVLCLETELNPEELLQTTQAIEGLLGRVRLEKWSERLIDIDILYYENLVYQTEHLQIPHLQIPFRRFTLVPLAEIAPEMLHPKNQLSQKKMLENCSDKLGVLKLKDYLIAFPQ